MAQEARSLAGLGYDEAALQGSRTETPEQVEAAMQREKEVLRQRRAAERAAGGKAGRCAHDVPLDLPCVECEMDAKEAAENAS